MLRLSTTLISISLAAVAVASDAFAAPSERPALAVRTLEYPSIASSSTIGSGLTHLFITELEKTGRYRIIERDALATLTDEVDLSESGYLDPGNAVKKGHIAGLDYWFLATVTNFGAEEKTMAGALLVPVIGGLGIHKKTARVRLDFRVVDATSGETVIADFGEAAVRKSSIAGGGYAGVLAGGDWYQSSEFLDSMLGRATIEAIGQTIEKMDARFPQARSSVADARREELRSTPGRVLAVVHAAAFVDLGADAGVEVGDVLNVYSVRDVLSSQGDVVYQDEQLIGEMTLTEVQLDRSRAAFEPSVDVVEGQVVRLRPAPNRLPAVQASVVREASPRSEPAKPAKRSRGGALSR